MILMNIFRILICISFIYELAMASIQINKTLETTKEDQASAVRVILETPLLPCRLMRVPQLRAFLEHELHKFPEVEVKQHGGDPRLIFFSGSGRVTGMKSIARMSSRQIVDILNYHSVYSSSHKDSFEEELKK
mmetsp:Transcript_37801/g.52487  ORF Transcript_37801/g.52487 Transcript_37801/m.52487 type:complete len:133 (+) Transcript_37801:232-630(+)